MKHLFEINTYNIHSKYPTIIIVDTILYELKTNFVTQFLEGKCLSFAAERFHNTGCEKNVGSVNRK